MSAILNSYVGLISGALNSLGLLAGDALGSAATGVGTAWDGILAVVNIATGSQG